MPRILTRGVDGILAAFLSRRQRERLGRHILNVVRGEGNADPETNGEYELLDQLKARWNATRTTPVIFDVGANVGEWSDRARSGLINQAAIYAFEPTKDTFVVLSKKQGIQAMNIALGDRDARLPLYVSHASGTAGTNSLHKRRAEAFGLFQSPGEPVDVRRGDDVARSLGVRHIHLLKIDTEGHEMAVLKGFSEILEQRELDYIQFEYGSTWADSRTLLMDAFDLLTPCGYRLAKIHPAGVQFFREYDQGEENFTFANYIAIREDLLPRRPDLYSRTPGLI